MFLQFSFTLIPSFICSRLWNLVFVFDFRVNVIDVKQIILTVYVCGCGRRVWMSHGRREGCVGRFEENNEFVYMWLYMFVAEPSTFVSRTLLQFLTFYHVVIFKVKHFFPIMFLFMHFSFFFKSLFLWVKKICPINIRLKF